MIIEDSYFVPIPTLRTDNSGIELRKVGILTLSDKVRIPTLRRCNSGIVPIPTLRRTSLLLFLFICLYQLSRPMGKPTIYIGENKGADQLRGNREADQHLCFRYSDSKIPPLLNAKISSF